MDTVKSRIDWVDYAKGLCVILVVMMHSTLGVEKATGQISALHGFIDWAKPFRIPDFFLIAGLFLCNRINKPWPQYLDAKVWYFAYFYALWMNILFLTRLPSLLGQADLISILKDYPLGYIEPYGSLWFIYMLAIFFIVAKLLRNVPPILVFMAAACLQMAPIETGWMVIDEFAGRFVFFFTGYWMAPLFFRFADGVRGERVAAVLCALLIWAVGNAIVVGDGYAAMPGIGLALGLVGICAVIAVSVLLSKGNLAQPLRYCGQHSLMIYLGFALFIGPARAALLRFGSTAHLSIVSLIVTLIGVLCPLILYWMVRQTRLAFLFKRPPVIRLSPPAQQWHSVGHDTHRPLATRQPSLSR